MPVLLAARIEAPSTLLRKEAAAAVDNVDSTLAEIRWGSSDAFIGSEIENDRAAILCLVG